MPANQSIPMQLHDTLTRQLAEITPGPDNTITIYQCGPTVYDRVTLGNLRTYISEDLLRRTLRATGYNMHVIMNLTDIDDKTIAKSKVEHPDLGPMEALIETTRHYEDIYKQNLASVGVDLSLIEFVRATDSIPAMQAMIRKIYDNGFAYISEGSVYFDLKRYRESGHDYGRLVNVNYSAQARVDNDEYDKAEASDFALWKGAKDGEPFWEFTLDEHDVPGRPGWHIECSAMALDHLKSQPITIHSGGIDLKFPHHENEIAQVVAATGQDFVRVFTHHGHLLVDGRRMGKSMNNAYTLADIEAKGFSPLSLRLLALQANHTSELNFTWESIEAAQNALGNLYAWSDLTHQLGSSSLDVIARLKEALAKDLDSPSALAILAKLDQRTAPAKADLAELDALLGLGLAGRSDITPDQKDLIADRQVAREAKDWAKADQLRDQLAEQGLEIDDTPAGPRWRRLTL
jgi:cysteinyl-tRNA synthetase